MKKPFFPGDQVRGLELLMYSPEYAVYTVTKCYRAKTETGWGVEIEKTCCPTCKREWRRFGTGVWSSNWFELVRRARKKVAK